MASCSMASAACGFAVAPNMAAGATTAKTAVVFFPYKNNRNSRLVVRAEEAAAPAAPPAEAPKAAKPPPIGPPRGSKVNTCCIVIGQDPNTRYPVVVRFNKVNYANVSTNNYALDEVEVV
ncbi:hypothetical protein BUALT_Bualt13G0026600 [Buddleja alternifolia]|uniref:Uncharacterized protein n=1 Tax=Buddleja alternifolia TaxID=168488 RepID=A0AAV6WV63_9LAMI|nr:hypothetical protein BUALT_Bualt13G0026600 [Buddleja alternifolia]